MATLDDKILGEKRQYYCSSSEDEADDSESSAKDQQQNKILKDTAEYGSTDFTEWNGTSSNTGPKGVIKVFEINIIFHYYYTIFMKITLYFSPT